MAICISFATPSLLLIFPFAMPIFYCLRSYLENLNPIVLESNSQTILHPFFISFLVMISNFAMGLPVLILYIFFRKKQVKRKRETLIQSLLKNIDESLDNISEENKNKPQMYKFFKLIQAIALIFWIALAVSGILIFSVILNTDLDKILIGFKMNIALLFLNAFFSIVVLKYKIFKHQILSMIICVIGIILVSFDVLTDIEDSLPFLGVYLIISLVDITEKWLMEKRYFNPSHLIFYIGCCGMVIYVIIFIITSLVDCPQSWEGFICRKGQKIEPIFLLLKDIYMYNPIGFLNMFLTILVGCFYLIFFFLTHFYFTPCHRSMSDTLSSFIMWIIGQKWNDAYKIILPLIGYLIIVFASLVYNELIILHCFGLEHNTKKHIHLRGRKETVSEIIQMESVYCIEEE